MCVIGLYTIFSFHTATQFVCGMLTIMFLAVLMLSFGVLLPDVRLCATRGKSSRDKSLG